MLVVGRRPFHMDDSKERRNACMYVQLAINLVVYLKFEVSRMNNKVPTFKKMLDGNFERDTMSE